MRAARRSCAALALLLAGACAESPAQAPDAWGPTGHGATAHGATAPGAIEVGGGAPSIAAPPRPGSHAPAAARPPAEVLLSGLFGRIAVPGASAAAGFGLGLELDGRGAVLGEFLRAALPRELTVELLELGDALFYLDPDGHGREQARRVAEFEPTLVFAPDFLFWFVYGPASDEPSRLVRLERGLALATTLAAEDTALVLGSVPHMEDANPLMLAPSWRPAEETLAAANARIRAFCAERPRTACAPLAEFVAGVVEDERAVLRGRELEGDEALALLQADLLHPSVRGTALLTWIGLEALWVRLAETDTALARALDEGLDWDLERVTREVFDR